MNVVETTSDRPEAVMAETVCVVSAGKTTGRWGEGEGGLDVCECMHPVHHSHTHITVAPCTQMTFIHLIFLPDHEIKPVHIKILLTARFCSWTLWELL